MDFDPGWDERLVAQAQRAGRAARGAGDLHLSRTPSRFEDGQPVRRPTTARRAGPGAEAGRRLRRPTTRCWPSRRTRSQARRRCRPSTWAPAACSRPGASPQEFPYDPWLYFHGEEQALALRLLHPRLGPVPHARPAGAPPVQRCARRARRRGRCTGTQRTRRSARRALVDAGAALARRAWRRWWRARTWASTGWDRRAAWRTTRPSAASTTPRARWRRRPSAPA